MIFFSIAIVSPDGMACFLGQLSELKARYDAKENKYRSQRDLLARQVNTVTVFQVKNMIAAHVLVCGSSRMHLKYTSFCKFFRLSKLLAGAGPQSLLPRFSWLRKAYVSLVVWHALDQQSSSVAPWQVMLDSFFFALQNVEKLTNFFFLILLTPTLRVRFSEIFRTAVPKLKMIIDELAQESIWCVCSCAGPCLCLRLCLCPCLCICLCVDGNRIMNVATKSEENSRLCILRLELWIDVFLRMPYYYRMQKWQAHGIKSRNWGTARRTMTKKSSSWRPRSRLFKKRRPRGLTWTRSSLHSCLRSLLCHQW